MSVQEWTHVTDYIRAWIVKIDDALLFIVIVVFSVMLILQWKSKKHKPFTKIAASIGKAINREMYQLLAQQNKDIRSDVDKLHSGVIKNLEMIEEKIDKVDTDLQETKCDVEDERAAGLRREIFDFDNAVTNGRKHTRKQWDDKIQQIDWYEGYIYKKKLKNGVFRGVDKKLRNVYQRRLEKGDFLPDTGGLNNEY